MIVRPDMSSPGQALEFRIWSDIITQSRGALHVFLPLLDRGLDGVVHRFTDGEYLPLQIKGRNRNAQGLLELVIPAGSLVDDRALIIATSLDDTEARVDLVIDEARFRELAARDSSKGVEFYSAAFSMDPGFKSKWSPYLAPREQLAERLLSTPVEEALKVSRQPYTVEPLLRSHLGFLGESEVIRRLAESPRLDLFRPFPDVEIVELLVRDHECGNFLGLQIKTGVPARYGEAHLSIRKATVSAADTTWLAGLAWLDDQDRFADECLFIRAADIHKVAVDDGLLMQIDFRPSSPVPTRLDPYRHQLAGLAGLAVAACADVSL